MKLISLVILSTFLIFLGACSSEESNSDDLPSKFNTDGLPNSALPRSMPSGNYSCTTSPSEWRGHEPELPAWLAVADSVFVGTISDVVEIESPIYLRDYENYTELDDISDCPMSENIRRAIRIDFEDVEVLYGTDTGTTLSIQMGGDYAAEVFGIGFRGDDNHLTDMYGNSVYSPGMRMGSALFTNSSGDFHWKYRQFEIIEGKIQLQEINEEAIRECRVDPLVTSIPDVHNGVSLAEFKSAIVNVNAQPRSNNQSEIHRQHQNFLDAFEQQLWKLSTEAYCVSADLPNTEDPSIHNDPNINP